jgi:iron complex transport system permease protein
VTLTRPRLPAAGSPAHALWLLGGLLLASLAALLLACRLGSVPLSSAELWAALGGWLHGQPDSLAGTLLGLRLERALAAWLTGAALALAGVLMQALLRNPLADPYILGVSSGAAVGALLTLLLGGALWMVDLAALAGAALVSAVLLGLARQDLRGGPLGATLLLLTGVMVSAGCNALISLMLAIAPDSRLRPMVFWLIGDLSGSSWRGAGVAVLALALLLCARQARACNVLALYGDAASTLGVPVARLRTLLFTAAAALTASAVATAGSIGFVGLIVPHACRFALGPDHRVLMPAAALSGGLLLVLADTAARTLLAPMQLPVGVITALIGVPAFLLQLRHVRRGQS